MEHDDFALDRTGVNRTAVLSLIFRLNASDLEIPLLGVGPDDREPCVVDHSSILVRQRD